MSFRIKTSCACCGRVISIDINSDLEYQVEPKDASPLVFEPEVDWAHFSQPNIIDAY